eukprot:SAG11_NODE_15283_length_583_cov_0.867769_1_plen_38_part_01
MIKRCDLDHLKRIRISSAGSLNAVAPMNVEAKLDRKKS